MSWQISSKLPNRWTIALIIAATGVTGAIVYYSVSQFGQTSQTSESAQTVPTIRQITALGRLEPTPEVIRVSAPTQNNDRIAQLLVQLGDRVEAGQVIAILDSRDHLKKALTEAQEQVGVAQSKLAQVRAGAKSGEIAAQEARITRLRAELQGEVAAQEATINRWQSQANTSRTEYNRYQSLYQEGAISASELGQKRLALETAQAQLKEATVNQNRTAETLRAQINEARATLDQIVEVRPVDVQTAQAEVDAAIAAAERAEADLNQAYIRAPIAGRILEIYARSGEAIGEDGIVELGQTDQMEVVAEVYRTDINEIREGQRAVITSESFSGELHGTVRQIEPKVSQQDIFSDQPGQNLDRKVVEVRIRLNPEDSKRVADLTNLQVLVAIQL